YSPERKPKRNVPENRPNASVTGSRLEAILADARARVERLRARRGELERAVTDAPPGRARTFLRPGAGQVGVIAEVKRRSPSAGSIQDRLDPVPYAQACVEGGA